MTTVFVPRRQFNAAVPEMIDRSDNTPSLLEEDLRNLRTINRYFGGLSALKSPLVRFFSKIPQSKTIEILDLATGSADHPMRIAAMARKTRRAVRILAVDRNPQILEVAGHEVAGWPEITLARRDLLHLDFANKSFDIVLCSLALHHFSEDDAVKILREMNRLSRIGFIVNDLNRSWIGAWTAWLYTHATTRNPLTLNDSYVSVLRAFTPDELNKLAVDAGLTNFRIEQRAFFRLILVSEDSAPADHQELTSLEKKTRAQ